MQGEEIYDEQSVRHLLPEHASQTGTEPTDITVGVAVKVCAGVAARFCLCLYQMVWLSLHKFLLQERRRLQG